MKRFIGVDIGGTNTKIGIVTRDGEITEKIKYPTAELSLGDGFIKNFSQKLEELLFANPDIKNVGIGIPGLISKDRRSLLDLANIPSLSGVPILDKLIQSKYSIVGVITAPDRPSGRGQKINESAVKVFSKSNGLTVLQPTNLKDDSFLNTLKALNANLQIVVAFRMLPKVVWQMPSMGTFNLHASLLPDYRGAAPINWAIINGEKETGVTTFFIDEKIDTGAVILQSKVEISPTENAGELHDKLMQLGANLVLKTVQSIETGAVKTFVQPLKETKTAYKLNKDKIF